MANQAAGYILLFCRVNLESSDKREPYLFPQGGSIPCGFSFIKQLFQSLKLWINYYFFI